MATENTRRFRDVSLLFSLVLLLFFCLSCRNGAGPQPQGATHETRAAAPASTKIGLVESFPIETTLDHASVPDAPDVWKTMIDGATRSIDLAEFYASEADTDALLATSKLAPIVDALEKAMKRGVRVRFLADALFAKTYPLTLDRLAKSGAAVRRIDVSKTSGGVLHAKYFVVDGEDAYLGSQNFDWRALAHIFEMGVRVRSRAFAGAMLDVFDTDWEIAGGAPTTTRVHAHAIASALTAQEGERVTFVASPRGWLPHEEEWDLPRLVATIDGAARALHVEVLTYKTKSRDGTPFHDLDDALRRAAARGVDVKLLVSDWASKPGSDSRRDLDALASVPRIEVRVIRIPKWSGGDIPFARVAHAKFMIADGKDAWVGTSNWEGDYFTASRNVGAIANGGALPRVLDGVFDDNWKSAYATPLADIKGEPPRGDAGPP